MKTLKRTGQLVITALTFMVMAATGTVKAQPGMSVSFQMFYDELSPYGEWIDDPEYGYIWLPDVDRDFQPYASRGHWVMTSYGNTWVSDYDWGWAPFHYGRWTYSDYYGWAWVPGYEWGPAWVSWRSGGGYYGWAPLGPRMSISINMGIPAAHWVFVPQRYICSPRIYSYYAPYRNRVNIYNRTTIINNTYVYNNRTYVTGPRHSEIERVTRSRVAIRDINSASRPGRASVSSRSVSLYRPEVDRSSRSSARPSRVADAATVRSAGSRSASSRTGGRTEATDPRTSSATRGTASRNNAATRGAQSTTRENGNTARTSRTSENRSKATAPARQSAPERTRTESRTGRESGNSPAPRAERNRASRPEVNSSRSQTNGRENVTPQRSRERVQPQARERVQPQARERVQPQARERVQPQTRERNQPAARVHTVSSRSSRENVRPSSSQTQRSTSSRNTSVSSRSTSRPSVSTSRSSERSSSAVRGRSDERSGSSRGRG